MFLDFDGVLHPEYDGQATPADIVFCHLPRFEGVMRDYPKVEIVIRAMLIKVHRCRFSNVIRR